MKELYCDFCVQILTDGLNYFLRYDGGEIATSIQEIQILESAAKAIMGFGSTQEVFSYLNSALSEERKNARTVCPSEYIGNTVKLIMG